MAIKSTDQVSIVDVTDAYGVILTSEAVTLIGDTAHALATTCTTQVVAYQGTTSVPVTVGTITCPSGITAAIADNGTATPTITFTVTAGVVAAACEAVIPVTVNGDVVFTKKYSFAVALKGATGSTGTAGTNAAWYTGTGITGTSTTETAFSGSGVSSAHVGDMYLNTSTQNTYRCTVAGAAAAAKWVYVSNIKGTTGATGTAGTNAAWYTGTTITGTATAGTVFSSSGVSSAHVGDMYLNTSTSATYRCVVAGAAATAQWSYQNNIKGATGNTGATGAPGADAITLAITSSAGTIFKNAAISTTLTAHVYQAGVELNSTQIAALGTINWYKDGGSTAVATGATLTINAGDVASKATYAAQLEG